MNPSAASGPAPPVYRKPSQESRFTRASLLLPRAADRSSKNDLPKASASFIPFARVRV
jgi:hypothetical protein